MCETVRSKRHVMRRKGKQAVRAGWGGELTDEIGHEEEDILGIGLGGGKVHGGFCVYDLDN